LVQPPAEWVVGGGRRGGYMSGRTLRAFPLLALLACSRMIGWRVDSKLLFTERIPGEAATIPVSDHRFSGQNGSVSAHRGRSQGYTFPRY